MTFAWLRRLPPARDRREPPLLLLLFPLLLCFASPRSSVDMHDVVVGVPPSTIHLDRLRGGLDPRLWALAGVSARRWGSGMTQSRRFGVQMQISVLSLQICGVNGGCGGCCCGGLTLVLLLCSSEVYSFAEEWGSKLCQDGDLASRCLSKVLS